jgi:hypothetical protein
MVVLLVLAFFIFFLAVDWFKTHPVRIPRGAYISPGFETLGALCNDGGKPVEEEKKPLL